MNLYSSYQGSKDPEGEREAIKAYRASQEESGKDVELDVSDNVSSALLNRVCMLNHPPCWITTQLKMHWYFICYVCTFHYRSSHLMSLADLQANGMLRKLGKETDGMAAKISYRWRVLERYIECFHITLPMRILRNDSVKSIHIIYSINHLSNWVT